MNSRKLLLLIISITFLCVFSHNSYSQSNSKILLAGKVLNSVSKEEIPFAHILLNNTRVGELADEFGVYRLMVNPGDSLHIKVIGFKDKVIAVPNITSEDMYKNIELEPKSYMLDEVCVYSLGTWEQFRQDFVHMKIEKTFEQKKVEEVKDMFVAAIKKELGERQLASGGVCISLGSTPAQRTKIRREKLAKSIMKSRILARKFNREIVAKIIGENEEKRLDLFMAYVNTHSTFNENTSQLEITRTVKRLYTQFEVKFPAKAKVKRDTTA